MYTFNLDRAIASWRSNLKRNRTFLGEDLDELEDHLRDHVEELTGEGKDLRDAYHEALTRLGGYGVLEDEYQKVRRGRSKRQETLTRDTIWTASLVKSYLRITFRSLRRQAFFTGLNVAGLAVGLASCLLILLYLADEVRYDRFHTQADQIYRMNWDFSWDGREGTGSGTPPPLAASLLREVPGIQAATRVHPISDVVVRNGTQFYTEGRVLAVDSTFLDVFDFEIIRGNPDQALLSPGSVVLTESTARRYFGDGDPLGQPLTIGDDGLVLGLPYSSSFTVTAVAADPPARSHIQFDMLTSMRSHPQVERFDWSWVWMQVVTYVVVPDAATIPAMEEQVRGMVARLAPAAFTRVGFSYDEIIQAGGRWDFLFQPLTDVYLGSADIGNRLGPAGSRTNLTLFAVVAAFILLIACINSMNLATARSSRRAGEVGVRKALGSARKGLFAQFMVESMVFSILAMGLAVGLSLLALPAFNQVAGKLLAVTATDLPVALLTIVGLTLVVGLLAGAYPGVYLSAFKPIDVLKGAPVTGKRGRRFRNALVVTQFAISIALIACTLLVRDQMQFFQEADLGFEQGGVLIVSNRNQRLGERALPFSRALEDLPEVQHASLTTGFPTTSAFGDYFKAEGRGDELFEMESYLVEEDYPELLGLELAAGKSFEAGSGLNGRSMLLNEAAVQFFGWEDPLGRVVSYSGDDFTVIGVVRNFHYFSLQQPIRPFALMHVASQAYQTPNSYVAARLAGGDLAGSVAAVRAAWEGFAPDQPFEYQFLDQAIQAQYETERRLGRLFLIYAGLAILVACLGLWGLAAFVAEKRTKEIGIRKSLGATEGSLVILLIRDFTKWVVVANVIAWPLAWLWMDDWLQEFAYQTTIGPGPFLWAGLAALVIAVATVLYQAARTARANPVQSLRYE